MRSPIEQTLVNLVRARYSLVRIASTEEARVLTGLDAVAAACKVGLYAWTCSQGLRQLRAVAEGFESPAEPGPTDPIDALRAALDSREPGIFVFCDLDPFIATSAEVRRVVRDIAGRFRIDTTEKSGPAGAVVSPLHKTLVLLSSASAPALPYDLRDEAEAVDWPLPTRQEIEVELLTFARQAPAGKRAEVVGDKEAVLDAALGLTHVGVSNVLARSVVEHGRFDVGSILAEKEQAAKRSGIVEYVRAAAGLESVGGLESLKAWALKRRRAFSPEAAAFGLPAPKGCLLLGVAGCGKSLSAKAIAAAWKLPLLRLDVGRCMGSLVGESEGNLRSAIATAEAIAPCVLWVDELEKAVAGSGTDTSGVTTRLVGQLLTWLSDKTSPVFVVATANDVSKLPPELLRKGRFDETFFVDLPDADERAAILGVHLSKRGRDAASFDARAVVARTEGFSGAELEQVVLEALTAAFDDGGRALTDADLLRAAAETVPLSKTAAEKLDALRAWCKPRARPASAKSDGKAGGVNAAPSRIVDFGEGN